MRILGIDPGMEGGLAVVAYGEAGGPTYLRYLRPTLLAVSDIPTTGEGSKRRVNVRAVMAWIRQNPPDHCLMEHAQAMPQQGVSGVFRYGRATGALEAVVQGLLIPMTLVSPVVWKSSLSLVKTDKEASRQRAIHLFPSMAEHLARKGDHGRAEAALIAYYGSIQLRQAPRAVAAE